MLAFPNGFDYRNFDSKLFNGNTFTKYCENLIKIGPVTPEITRAKSTSFWKKRQKLTLCQISQQVLSEQVAYWTELYQRFSIGRHLYADYKTEINFAAVEETLPW